MSKVIDADSQIREVKDVDQSGGKNSPKASIHQQIGDPTRGTNVAVICTLLCTITMLGTVWALYQAAVAERETRMLQYYLLELDARAIRYGIKTDDESIAKKLSQPKEK